jgi:hypothetical protein
MRIRLLHASLAYVMRVDDRTRVAYTAATPAVQIVPANRLHARLAYVMRVGNRAAYVMRVDDRSRVTYAAATPAVRKVESSLRCYAACA